MKTALVCGANGFIGHHLVHRLKKDGYWVRGVDSNANSYAKTHADEFVIGDLRKPEISAQIIDRPFDEVYQLAADMGGAGYVFTGDNDANIMHSSALINLNILEECRRKNVKRIFYASSACVYPEPNQQNQHNSTTTEDSAYPASPGSEYGWEKLFSERLYLSYHRCYGTKVRIVRLHNIFGPECSWNNGREKSAAAICRKVAMASDGDELEIWGDGNQTRSYLFIDDCLDGMQKLMTSDWTGPVNMGSDEMISINELAKLVINIADKNLILKHIPGPVGINSRNSDNTRIKQMLGWSPPNKSLLVGLEKTYSWVLAQVEKTSEKIR
jgi:GDP-D-mannose 3',5'-epimerase